MAPTISLALVLHNHQPVGNFGWVIEEVFRKAYEPMIGALERHPRVRLGLHYTGPLLEWLRINRPDTIDRLRVLVTRDQVEILGGAHYEPIIASLPRRDRHGQLVRMADELQALFGQRPRGAWLAERVWEPSLPYDLAEGGYDWTVLDDNHLRSASVREDGMWGAYTTDDEGRMTTIFGTEQGLRYLIPFGEVDKLIGYLRDHATDDGLRLGTMGDDGEKFGAWPGTFEHCWGSSAWVDRCFAALEENAEWLTTVTPSGWLQRQTPIGRIYVPTASYVEMTQWALPADEANAFHDVLQSARTQGRPESRFLRGGFWRNFQSRYREINDLHKQMLRTSAKVERMPPGRVRDLATDHLYRGQSNDCYWHGLFGGIYIVHMRMATLAHLIAAEDHADRMLGSLDEARTADLDLDGIDEVLMATAGQSIVVDLAEGAGIGSWDLRASRVALGSVLRRRPEAYHETLIAHDRDERERAAGDEPSSHADAGTPKTIHDIVMVKEHGLSGLLVYDRHERRSALVHFLPPDRSVPAEFGLTDAIGDAGAVHLDAAALGAGRVPDLGDFADRPWNLVRLAPGHLEVRRHGSLETEGGPCQVVVTKRLTLGGGRSDPSLEVALEVTNTGGATIETDLGLGFAVNLMGGGANPAAYYERVDRAAGALITSAHDGAADLAAAQELAFGNRDEGVRITLDTGVPARVSWYPVETVSNSEAGFERAYQGSSLLLRWPLSLEPGQTARRRVSFAVTQERDLAEEDLGPDTAAVSNRADAGMPVIAERGS
ncbi:MAG: DUF1926 domain-containing protein [Chloroflexi bacterium]|nr:DUF1926 domain-containing protein [Chloroflexota bacterium]